MTPAQLTGLSSAIVSAAQTVAASRQSRRIGLLTTVAAALPANVNVGKVAEAAPEVQEARTFLAGATAIDGSLNALRAGGGSPLFHANEVMAILANIPAAAFTFFANALVDLAGQFETLELETLPS